jgi:quinol monooxygenase YgiN
MSSNETLRVVARITAQTGKESEVKSILLNMVGQTRQDQGCIRYELLQSLDDPCDFTFVEEWASDAEMQAHLTTPHVQNASSQAQFLLAAEPDIRRYARIA